MNLSRTWAKFRAWIASTIAALALAIGALLGIQPGETQQTVDTLTWTNPTTRTDGSALTNLVEIRIQWGAQGGPYNDGQRVVAAPSTSITVPRDATPGTRCYVAVAVDAGGLESAPSNEACKTITAPPDAIGDLSVN